ncbi:MAG: branched-chain amino acid ABC transporter permease [Firmicutes bacterium]|nr:branched-chain amino acid ABC transporter permease [Bacillota bacterium]
MNLTLFGQTLVSGLLQGGIYAQIAMGLMLGLGVLGIINFAHGEFLMIAMYVTLIVFRLDINPYLAIFISFPLLYFLGVILAKYLIIPILDRETMAQFLIMIGLSLVLMNLAMIIFSPNFYTVKAALTGKTLKIGEIIIGANRLLGFAISILVTGALLWMMQKTELGRNIRAVSQNRYAASLVGVNVKAIYQIAFGISLATLGISGPFLTPIYYVSPNIGSFFILFAFAIVIVGGMGNFKGALVASFLIGLADAFGAVLLPGSTGPILPFIFLILTLLFKPKGLFGGSGI